jgi:hypothetical protein
MKQIKALLERGFQSSSGKTPEFSAFARLFKKHFTKELESVGALLKVYSIGHFYVSGFFTIDEQLFYFSISDVRNYKEQGHWGSVLIRTAQHLKDFTGGTNTYTDGIQTGMMKEWVRISRHFGYLPKRDGIDAQTVAVQKWPGSIGA